MEVGKWIISGDIDPKSLEPRRDTPQPKLPSRRSFGRVGVDNGQDRNPRTFEDLLKSDGGDSGSFNSFTSDDLSKWLEVCLHMVLVIISV